MPQVIYLVSNRDCLSPREYVRSLARLAYGSLFSGPRYLAVIVYCDESYDSNGRIFTLAGFLAPEDEWARLTERWKARCEEAGISCYHATDCAGQWGEFAGMSRDDCVSLNADLMKYLTETELRGFGVSISRRDFEAVLENNRDAERFLGPEPYCLGMQALVMRVCHEVRLVHPQYELAFVFDRNEQVSGKAKMMYDEVRKRNSELAPCMGSLTYADRRRFVPLQAADELAFEVMKNALGVLENRPERKPITRLREAKVLCRLEMFVREGLEQTAKTGKLAFFSDSTDTER